MNKIYRLVWNKYLALWTVVSEIARGTTKKRNVSVSASAVLSPLLNANSGYTKSKLPPVMLAALITSIFYSSNSFAGYEAGGGSTYTNCTGTSTGSGTKSGNSVAIGTRACAGGNGNLAMGYQADSSNAPDNIAFGSNAKTGNVLSPTPDGTPLNGGGQIAIGKNAQTTTAGAIAIGNDAKTGGQNFSVAIGGYAEASGNSAVAFGRRTVASGFGGVAVGANASSSGSDSTAVGSNATASMQAATALGNQALASGRGSTAVGFGANAVSVGSVAVGVNSYAAGRVKNGEDWESGAFGSNSKADGAGAVALGNYSQALADETTATGNGSKATANYATALGTLAEATAEEAVSIGHQAKAQSLSDIAIGSDATTAVGTGGHNIAMGNKVTTGATGQNVAIGSDSTTANSRTANGGAVAIGRAQTATGDGAVAIGDPNVVNGDGAIALGKDNTAAGDSAGATAANGAVALGNSNQAIGQGSVALGNTSTAAAAGAIAFGDTAAAKGGQSVSIGSNTQAVQGGDIAIGAGAYAAAKVVNGVPESAAAFGLGARADGATALAVGNNAQATADYAGALGNAAEATALEASAVGNRAQATKDYSTAVGTNATASGLQSTALGNRSRATGDFAIAQGNNTEASGQFATSVGNFSKATAESAIAVGDLANASANDATAIGTRAAASGQNSNAIGIDSKATGNAAVALGAGAAASADNALATGVGARAAAASAVALGDSANAQATRGVALGSGATATNADDVALGAGSVTGAANPTANGTVGGVTYNYAGTTPSSVVSVGSSGNERQITNVAAGRVSESSTDAINGSQLYSTQQALGNLAESTANHLGGGSVVNPDGTVTAPSYDINGTTVSNVGDALSELDKGWNLQSNGANAGAIKAGDTVDIGTVNGEENLTVTKNGNTIQYGLNKDLKVDSVTAGDTVINDNGVTITNGPSITKSGINAAGNPISNVGAGVNDTDAVNKGQLDGAAAAAKTEVTEGKNITVSKTTGADGQDIYNVATADNVEFNNVKVGDVTIDGTTGKISGVAAGDVNATSTDAINGSQLAGTAKSVSDALGGGSVVNPDGTMTAPSYDINGTTVSNVGDALSELDKGWNLQSNGANAGAIKAGDTVDIGTVTGEENLTVTKNGNTIQYGLNKDIKVDSVTAGDTVINDNGVTITNGPSITKSGINAAGNPISNVGAGVNDTDAVNKGQLDGAAAAAKTEVTEGKNITVTKTTGADGQDIYNVATADNVEFNNVKVGDVTIDGTTGKISGVAAGDVNATSTDAINGSQLAGTAKSVLDALGGGSTVNPDGTVSAPSYTVNGNNVSNVGDAITELDKGWNLQSNGANAGAIKAGDTVDIGTVTGEENLTVTKNGNTIQYGLNKDLKVDSVTAGDTVINDNGVTITNGPSITKSGINAAGNPISNVGAGVNDTDAVNKGQLDDAAAAAKTEVTQGKNITVSKTTGADGQDIYNVATADNVEFNNVKVGDVTIDGTTGKISGVAAGDVNATSTDAINGSQLAGTAKSVSDALGGGSVVNPDGTVTAPSYDINGTTVSNVGDALSELDKGWNLQSNGANAGAIKAGDTVDIGTVNGEENLTVTKNGNTIQYGLNKDLKVDSVTAGDTVINDNGVTITNGPSITKSGINAAGNSISNVADGTAPGDAVNKGQLDGAAAAAKTEVTQGKNITVSKTTGADGQDIYNVATANDVDFNNVTVGDVIIDGATGKISGVADGTIAAGSTEAINGSQLHGVADSVRNSIGGNTVLNPDGTVTTSNVGNTGESNIHDAIDSVRKNAVTAKTTVTEGDNMVVTKSTNPDGSTNYEVAT
ncbi:ESPR-type extended signal peptide-containing protein, partial [Acinetobacter colistiniresistens]